MQRRLVYWKGAPRGGIGRYDSAQLRGATVALSAAVSGWFAYDNDSRAVGRDLMRV